MTYAPYLMPQVLMASTHMIRGSHVSAGGGAATASPASRKKMEVDWSIVSRSDEVDPGNRGLVGTVEKNFV